MAKKRHGMGGWSGKRGEGQAYKWICDHVSYEGDDCLFWPMSRGNGYGTVGINGKSYRASRFMCKLAHGDPPTPQHQAAHSCGNGKSGCLNPNHLSWKTNGENQRERDQHGTRNVWGGDFGRNRRTRGKFTPEQDEQIRRLADTHSQLEIADMFGVTHSTIQYRLYGGSYKPRRKRLMGAG